MGKKEGSCYLRVYPKSSSRQKRAETAGMQIILWTLFSLVLVLLSMVVLFTQIKSVADSSFFDRIYYVRDVGLVTSAIYAAPGNVEAYYPNDLSPFVLTFTNTTFFLQEGNSQPFRFFYGSDNSYHFPKQQVDHPLVIVKQDHQMLAFKETNPAAFPRLQACGAKGAQTLGSVTAIFDPAFSTTTERQAMNGLMTTLQSIPQAGFSKSFTRSRTGSPTIDQRLTKITGKTAYVGLTVGTNPEKTIEEVVAYIPKPSDSRYAKSHSLACSILNRIHQAFPQIEGAAIIPSNDRMLYQGNTYAIILAVGNDQYTAGQGMELMPGEIGRAIAEGFSDHFPDKVIP